MSRKFQSPTRGALSLGEVFADMAQYIEAMPGHSYRLIIGTDSQCHEDQTVFVTALVVHREGKGARYFYRKEFQRRIFSLRQRIFFETSLSLEVASHLTRLLAENGLASLDLEVHLDAGKNGETRELIREIVGMVTGSGFHAKIKPESYGAFTVADRYTK